MPRATPAAVMAAARAEFSEPIYLVHIATGAPASAAPEHRDLYLCTGDGAVDMGGVRWTPKPLELGEVLLESHEESGSFSFNMVDTDNLWRTLLAAGAAFEEQPVIIYHTFRSLLGLAQPLTNSWRDDWEILNFDRPESGVVLHVQPRLAGLRNYTLPRRTIKKRDFPGLKPVNAL